MKKYTAFVKVDGVQVEQTFNVPDLLECEMFIFNSIGIKNSHTGQSDQFIGIKRERRSPKKRK